jgi:hypothetical protein
MTPRPAPVTSSIRRHGFSLLIVACTLLVFLLAFLSPVSYARSDSLFNLVVSQAILDHGTIRLDAYVERIAPQMERPIWEIVQYKDHAYYMYPLGTPVFSLPFVWIANRLGWDMSILDQNVRVQNCISALLCALMFLVIYRTGRYYLSPWASLVIALLSVLGSAFISTVGTALWNVDLAVLFLALSVNLLARYDSGRAGGKDAYLLGFTLFAAFFCRPTAALFIVFALGYLWLTRHREGVKVALAAFGFLLLFTGFNWLEIGQPLPDYYLSMPLSWLRGRQLAWILLGALGVAAVLGLLYLWIARPRYRTRLLAVGCILLLLAVGSFWLASGHPVPDVRLPLEELTDVYHGTLPALYGSLLGPSRGLLVNSPFLVPVLLGCLLFWKKLDRKRLAGVALLSSGLHVLAVASSNVWAGGHGFGPRLLTETLPALVLLTIIVWKTVSTTASLSWRRMGATGYVVLGIVGIFIHSYQGLLNLNTFRWNGEIAPDMNRRVDYVFDWRYPQFLATSQSICDRNREYLLETLTGGFITVAPYYLGDWITHSSGEDGTRSGAAGQGGVPLSDLVAVDLGMVEAARPPGEYQVLVPMIVHTVKNAVFVGWLRAEEDRRWSTCRSSEVVFQLGPGDTERKFVLEIIAGSFGYQGVVVLLNDTQIGKVAFPGPKPPVLRTLTFDGSLLRPNALNEIEFYVPNAMSPQWWDDRTIGLALSALRIRPAE